MSVQLKTVIGDIHEIGGIGAGRLKENYPYTYNSEYCPACTEYTPEGPPGDTGEEDKGTG